MKAHIVVKFIAKLLRFNITFPNGQTQNVYAWLENGYGSSSVGVFLNALNGSCFDERCHDKDSTFLTRLGETDVLENIAKISALYMFKFIYMFLRLYLSNVIF